MAPGRFTHSTRPVAFRAVRAVACALAVVIVVGFTPSSVRASPDTLRGALTNLVGAPFDIALAPVIAARRTAENRGIEANPAQRTAWSFFGFLGQTGLQVLTGAARATSGALQLVPGVLLFPFPGTDLPDHLDPFGTGDGMIDLENPLGRSWVRWVPPVTPLTIDLKIGVRSKIGDFREPDLEHYPGTVPLAETEEPQDEMSAAPQTEPEAAETVPPE